jgi:oligoribonuclease
MSANGQKLIWIDCEMTGLDPDVDELVEIAVVITDYQLIPLDEGMDAVIAPTAGALEKMGNFVKDMHTTSGLLEDIPSGISLDDTEKLVLDYFAQHGLTPGACALAGNSVGTDRMFIRKFLPAVHDFLHYRNVDVSTIKVLSRHWYPKVFFNQPAKNGGHRARADIFESIRELDYYRRAVFVDEPGPTTEEAREAANGANGFPTGHETSTAKL